MYNAFFVRRQAVQMQLLFDILVGVAQLVESRLVAPVVAGSSPVTHPL